jgi:hypothetical protein
LSLPRSLSTSDESGSTSEPEPASVGTPPAASDAVGLHGWRRFLPAGSMLAVVLAGALIPLFRNPGFYYWDDTAAVAAGVWQRIPDALLSGELPFLMLDMWRGGNLIAEAATGMWNPVMVGLMLGTHPIDDLAVAMALCKITLFLIMSLGVYRLSRGYGANRWMAALAGATLPLSGWALFIDGTSWINGTAIAAFTPWAWWALHRAMRRGWTPRSIVVAVVAGYLLASVGNPYGLLTLAVAYFAIAIEMFFTGRARAMGWLVATGAVTLGLSVVVYLPFLLTSSVGFRADSGVFNDEFLAVNLSNLLGMSTPTYFPYIRMFGTAWINSPAMYLAWFALPIVPWLRWQMPRTPLLALSSVFVFGGLFLMLALGPSQFFMFRWPARLIPFAYLAILIVLAVVASRGFAEHHRRARATASAVLVLIGAWQAASDMPGLWRWHVVSIVGVLLLGTVFVLWCRRSPGRAFAVLAIGLLPFILVQMMMTPGNTNVANYNLPTSRVALLEGIGERYEGVTIQVADPMGADFDRAPDGDWQDMLVGTQFAIAGVDAVNSYSGIGFTALDTATCMTYNGSTCPQLWESLWTEPESGEAPLADLLGVHTVVLKNGFVTDPVTPEGWSVEDVTDAVTVYVRDAPLPDGRVTWTDAAITSDTMVGTTGEDVSFTSEGDGGSIVFGRLAWPGYTATIDGERVPVETGPAGLVRIEIPEGVTEGTVELRFTPPGLWIGGAAAAVSIVGLIALLLLAARRRSAR